MAIEDQRNIRIEKEIIRTDQKSTLLLMSTMEKLFHMIKLMNFVVDEYDGETLLHDEANAETRKVHIISDLDMKKTAINFFDIKSVCWIQIRKRLSDTTQIMLERTMYLALIIFVGEVVKYRFQSHWFGGKHNAKVCTVQKKTIKKDHTMHDNISMNPTHLNNNEKNYTINHSRSLIQLLKSLVKDKYI